MMKKFVPLEFKGKQLGLFDISTTTDKNYPGLDIEFLSNTEDTEGLSRPRVLIEYNEDDGLRVLVWGDKNSEDYTDEIIFK